MYFAILCTALVGPRESLLWDCNTKNFIVKSNPNTGIRIARSQHKEHGCEITIHDHRNPYCEFTWIPSAISQYKDPQEYKDPYCEITIKEYLLWDNSAKILIVRTHYTITGTLYSETTRQEPLLWHHDTRILFRDHNTKILLVKSHHKRTGILIVRSQHKQLYCEIKP